MEQPPVPVTGRRLGHSALLALVLTVGLALFAAYAGPYSTGPDAPPSPARTGIGGARAAPVVPTRPPPPPTPSPLPALRSVGEGLDGQLLVQAAGYRFLDLHTGTLGAVLGFPFGPNGNAMPTQTGFVFLSTRATALADGHRSVVSLKVVDTTGQARRDFDVGTFRGYNDPALPKDEQGESVIAAARTASDGNTVFVGLAIRGREEWRRSVLAVDLERPRVIGRFELDTVPLRTGTGAARAANAAPTPGVPTYAYAWPPEIDLSPSGRSALLTAEVVVDGRVNQVRRWRASVDRFGLGSLRPFRRDVPALQPDQCRIDGYATEETYYSLCWLGGGPSVLRLAADGSVLGETSVKQVDGEGIGIAQAVDRAAGKLYLWNMTTRTLARLSLISGKLEGVVTIPQRSSAEQPESLVGALAHGLSAWLAPSAAAKVFVDPGLALSPDGTRLYGLAVDLSDGEHTMTRAAGIYAFDAGTLAVLDWWQPTADFASLAVSDDGTLVFAAGLAGVDAAGNETGWPASVTAYDAQTGEIRLIAGDLGDLWITLRTGVGH
jgi:hypothetical protein